MRIGLLALLVVFGFTGCSSAPAREPVPREVVLRVQPVDVKKPGQPPQFYVETKFLNGESVMQSPSLYTLGNEEATIFVGVQGAGLDIGPDGKGFVERKRVIGGYWLSVLVKTGAPDRVTTKAAVVRDGWIVCSVADDRAVEPGRDVRLALVGEDPKELR